MTISKISDFTLYSISCWFFYSYESSKKLLLITVFFDLYRNCLFHTSYWASFWGYQCSVLEVWYWKEKILISRPGYSLRLPTFTQSRPVKSSDDKSEARLFSVLSHLNLQLPEALTNTQAWLSDLSGVLLCCLLLHSMWSPEACSILAGITWNASEIPSGKCTHSFCRETGACVEVWGEEKFGKEVVHGLLLSHHNNLMHLCLGFSFYKSGLQAWVIMQHSWLIPHLWFLSANGNLKAFKYVLQDWPEN